MLDPHPPFASFAPSILIVIAIFEIIDFTLPKSNLRTPIKVLTFIGLIGISLAFVSGYFAGVNTNPSFKIPDSAFEDHHLMGRLSLICYFPFLICGMIYDGGKKRLFKVIYAGLFVLCVVLTIWTAKLGGELVFDYGGGGGVATNSEPL